MLKEAEKLTEIKAFVFRLFHDDVTGHDDNHMQRVAEWSRLLAVKEGADPFLSEVAGWLHDVGDDKLFASKEEAIKERDELLRNLHFSERDITYIHHAIETVSFRKGKTPDTLLGKVVQDADRLDAIGAIGIARTFAFGGAKNQPLYRKEGGSSFSHFHEKLLLLKDKMNTPSGREEADRRHQFMEEFINQFNRETASE